MSSQTLSIAVIGRDKPGVVAKITNFLCLQHANMEALKPVGDTEAHKNAVAEIRFDRTAGELVLGGAEVLILHQRCRVPTR